jgi:hypothetical protein
MSYRPRRRRGRRGRLTIGEYLRDFALGVVILGLAATLMAIGAYAGSAVSSYGSFNLTIGGNTVTVDLGFIPTIITAVASVLLFLYGLRRIIRTSI